jgi:hypothetical protein
MIAQLREPRSKDIRRETAKAIRELVLANPRLRACGYTLSMYIGADEVLLAFDVEFEPETNATEVSAAIAQMERRSASAFPRSSESTSKPFARPRRTRRRR